MRFRVISETQGLVWTGDDAARAEEVALATAVGTGRTVYLQEGTEGSGVRGISAAVAGAAMTMSKAEKQIAATYTYDEVHAAVNKAANDIIEAADLPDEGARDALNLCVNATLNYLDGTATDLSEVVDHGYEADLDEVLGWINP
jgi:hypothetical protein